MSFGWDIPLFWYGADRGTRTPDPRITNALLYQLSHIGETDGKGNTFFWIALKCCEENVVCRGKFVFLVGLER